MRPDSNSQFLGQRAPGAPIPSSPRAFVRRALPNATQDTLDALVEDAAAPEVAALDRALEQLRIATNTVDGNTNPALWNLIDDVDRAAHGLSIAGRDIGYQAGRAQNAERRLQATVLTAYLAMDAAQRATLLEFVKRLRLRRQLRVLPPAPAPAPTPLAEEVQLQIVPAPRSAVRAAGVAARAARMGRQQ